LERRIRMVKLTSQQTGRCGELLVQYRLLKHGVESAPLTTDRGVDLVAFHSKAQKAVTIQVKTSTHHTELDDPVGSKWGKWLLWEIRNDCPTDYIAAVDLVNDKFWFISIEEFKQKATHAGENFRLLWYIPEYEPAGGTEKREEQFKEYEMDTVIPRVFGLEYPSSARL
jgi:hypothetical protein